MSNRVVEIGAKAAYDDAYPAQTIGWENVTEVVKDDWRKTVRAVLAALEKEGYRVVEMEPTEEMVAARRRKDPNYYEDEREIWGVMFDAAPRYGEPSDGDDEYIAYGDEKTTTIEAIIRRPSK